MSSYQDFLARKAFIAPQTGIDKVPGFHSPMFPFQRDVVRWALRRGRAALFEDCGLGKTIQQLEWARQVCNFTGGPVLILCPPGVREQTRSEGEKFGILANIVNSGDDIRKALCPDGKPYKGIYITNYEKLHKFDPSIFEGVALDESSILKAYDGKTRTAIIESFKRTRFKLACTATPSPNDHMELGNHAEFLGAMSRTEMLSTFFVHDGGDTSKWRLKGHAQDDFWRWVCTWAIHIRKPSDLGYADDGFELPPIGYNEHVVDTKAESAGMLFAMPASSLQERRSARRASLEERCQKTVELARKSGQSLIWCNLNDEQDRIADLLGDDCVSIAGSTDEDDRVSLESHWRSGGVPHLISKPSIFGFGMNWQHCSTVIYCGLSDSYEDFYQSVRRCWRFGQRNPVKVHVVVSNLEDAVLANIKRKQADADRMAFEMVKHMASISSAEIKGISRTQTKYNPTIKMEIPQWLAAA